MIGRRRERGGRERGRERVMRCVFIDQLISLSASGRRMTTKQIVHATTAPTTA